MYCIISSGYCLHLGYKTKKIYEKKYSDPKIQSIQKKSFQINTLLCSSIILVHSYLLYDSIFGKTSKKNKKITTRK